MKRLLFCLLMVFTPLSSFNVSSLLQSTDNRSTHQQIEDAISNSDITTVLRLVKPDINSEDLDHYIYLAKHNFGKAPKASFKGRLLGSFKITMGLALLYKTADYFKTEFDSLKSKSDILTRYKSMHNLLMDFACISGFISSYNTVNSGINNITPQSNYKKQLLIHLYLQNLLKK